jgi:hypothetical protein
MKGADLARMTEARLLVLEREAPAGRRPCRAAES